MAVFLMGGNEFRRDCEAMDRALLSYLPGLRVAIVPTAAAGQGPGRAAENGMSYFRRLGAEAVAVMILNRQDAEKGIHLDALSKADMIYLTGGSPGHVLETLRGTSALEVIRTLAAAETGIVAGSSAGAMALCEVMRMGLSGSWHAGLGIVPGVGLLVHHEEYLPGDPEQVRLSLPPAIKGLGLDTASGALWSGGGEWLALGSRAVTTYEDGRTLVYQHGETFQLT